MNWIEYIVNVLMYYLFYRFGYYVAKHGFPIVGKKKNK
jgi:hypothetical protein